MRLMSIHVLIKIKCNAMTCDGIFNEWRFQGKSAFKNSINALYLWRKNLTKIYFILQQFSEHIACYFFCLKKISSLEHICFCSASYSCSRTRREEAATSHREKLIIKLNAIWCHWNSRARFRAILFSSYYKMNVMRGRSWWKRKKLCLYAIIEEINWNILFIKGFSLLWE
jgi:hypothetical protein